MRVLITGAFGFVGRNLSCHLAAKGHRLVALDMTRQELGAYSEFIDWSQIDAFDWSEIDAVVHLAGKAHDTRNTSDPQSYFDVNVGLTRRILLSAVGGWRSKQLKSSSRSFFLFSSVKAVADQVEGILTEENTANPQTPYGQSKMQAEAVVWSVIGSQGHGVRSYVIRPSMIYGPRGKGNLNVLFSVVRRGVPWPLGGFENRRSFASIDNVCASVEGLLVGCVPSGVYQVADDETLSTNELIELMSEVAGRRARVWRIPANVVCAAARLGDVLRLPLTSERLKKLTESYVVSNVKLKQALGWRDMPVRARDGLKLALRSFVG